MTRKQLDHWVKQLGKAWVNKNPEIMADICAQNVKYYESPFAKPLIGPEAVKKQWQQDVPGKQKEISFGYDSLAIAGDMGIVHWWAEFTTLSDGKRMIMDGIFQVSLNAEGKCTEFHQWWIVK